MKNPNLRRIENMAQFIKVANTGDLTPGSGKLVEVEGKPIALFNIEI